MAHNRTGTQWNWDKMVTTDNYRMERALCMAHNRTGTQWNWNKMGQLPLWNPNPIERDRHTMGLVAKMVAYVEHLSNSLTGF